MDNHSLRHPSRDSSIIEQPINILFKGHSNDEILGLPEKANSVAGEKIDWSECLSSFSLLP